MGTSINLNQVHYSVFRIISCASASFELTTHHILLKNKKVSMGDNGIPRVC